MKKIKQDIVCGITCEINRSKTIYLFDNKKFKDWTLEQIQERIEL